MKGLNTNDGLITLLPKGDPTAKVWIIGEFPNRREAEQNYPLSGAGGVELSKMLRQNGIDRSEVYIDYAYPHYVPGKRDFQLRAYLAPNKTTGKKHGYPVDNGKFFNPSYLERAYVLRSLANLARPDFIFVLGDLALWAFTGEWGAYTWRGSVFRDVSRWVDGTPTVCASLNPDTIIRDWSSRYLLSCDTRRFAKWIDGSAENKETSFRISPTFRSAREHLKDLLRLASEADSVYPIAADVETFRGYITCLGFAWSDTDAICIPFVKGFDHYWDTVEEEEEITLLCLELLKHPKVFLIGQNWNYDAQYFVKFFGLFRTADWDTMTTHHILFADMKKSLDFQSSIYLDDHKYWKDESKFYNPMKDNPEQHWIYNCKDAVNTYRIYLKQLPLVEKHREEYGDKPYGAPVDLWHRLQEPVLSSEARGIRVDKKRKMDKAMECDLQLTARLKYLHEAIRPGFNPNSPKQLQDFFYKEMNLKPVTKWNSQKKRRTPTCDEKALETIAKRDPIFAPVCQLINEFRSIRTYHSVCVSPLDSTGRYRYSLNTSGTNTFRFSGGSDSFNFGHNPQNLSEGNDSEIVITDDESLQFYTPNVRKILLPEPGYLWGDFDLDQADARVVAWEADEPSLKEIFNDPDRDIHNENCEIIYGSCTGDNDPRRKKSKAGIHLTNYGGTAPVLAKTLGITTHEADRFQNRYFGERPGIKQWHEKIQDQITTTRTVENAFGFGIYFYGRIQEVFKHALAWIPQSTVGIVTSIGILNIWDNLRPDVMFYLQVHDSNLVQIKQRNHQIHIEAVRKAMSIEVPYDDPLIIPVSYKTSRDSWGDCK